MVSTSKLIATLCVESLTISKISLSDQPSFSTKWSIILLIDSKKKLLKD
jgi:hypothetical protein